MGIMQRRLHLLPRLFIIRPLLRRITLGFPDITIRLERDTSGVLDTGRVRHMRERSGLARVMSAAVTMAAIGTAAKGASADAQSEEPCGIRIDC